MALAAFNQQSIKTFNINNDLMHNTDLIHLNQLPLSQTKPFQWTMKRIMDVTLSLMAIIALAPLFLLLTILIKIDSKGSAVFKQKRVGINKKEFYMYKFRSMVNDAEEKFEQVKEYNQTNPIMFKASNDPRITKVGKFIRRYSLDELPQLFNVLKGEMSLVGPRPPLLRELKEYKSWHYVRFQTIPGLTGMWQVSGRANITDFDAVVNLDYKYIKNWNILMDIGIILKTIPVVINGNGAA